MTFQQALIETTKEFFLILWKMALTLFHELSTPLIVMALLFAPAVIFVSITNLMNWTLPTPIIITALTVMYFLEIIFTGAISRYRLSKKQRAKSDENDSAIS